MKKLVKFSVFVFALALCIAVLCGCSGIFSKGDGNSVTNIIVAKSEAYISSYGNNNTFQIYPSVYPENATNKKVIFQVADIDDAGYLSVSDTGLVQGVKPKEGKPVEIRIKSADNTRITASVFVYVEDRSVERLYFNPLSRDVYIDQAPFAVQASYYPSHAAEGTNLTYTSDNPTVATVDAISGTVTVQSRGVTNIIAENTSGIKGYLELSVRMTPPSYQLIETPSNEMAYNQVPENPIGITYTLIPGVGNDTERHIRWFAESKEIVEKRDKLTFEYVPTKGLLPGVYNVRVEITDSDDQKQKINSKNINIFDKFTDTLGIEVDTSKEYFVSDRIDARPLLNQDQQRPEAFQWWMRVMQDGDTEAILSDYRNYSLLATTSYLADGGAFAYYPKTSGNIVLAMVPIVDKKAQYPLLKHSKPIIVNLLSSGNPYYGVNFATVTENNRTLLKLQWGFMPQESAFVAEINVNGVTKFMSSTDAEYAALFTETSVTFPDSVLSVGQNATIRLRTDRFGFGDEISYRSGSAESNLGLTAFAAPVEGLPFDFFADSMAEIGDVLNYIRFFRPGQPGNYAAASGKISYVRGSDEYPNAFTFDLAFGFDFAEIDTGRYDPTTAPFNGLSRFYMKDSELPAGATVDQIRAFGYLKADYNEIIDKVLSAFLAYGESGSVSIAVMPKYLGSTGGTLALNTKGTFTVPLTDTQANYARVSVYLKDEPSVDTLESEETMKKQKVTTGYKAVISESPRGYSYDNYFADNLGEMTVYNGQQLYLATVWNKKPVPAAGSVAEAILTQAKGVLNAILGDDIVGELAKAEAIHDFIVTVIDYDYNLAARPNADALSYGFCLEGVFLREYAVCDGLSKAYALLCRMEGLVAFKISGVSYDAAGRAGGHAWNKVLIDGVWRLVDTTWDCTYSPRENPNTVIPTKDFFYKKDGDTGFRESIDRKTYGEYPSAK